MSEINYYYIRIRNPKHSEVVQKRLFELGYKWANEPDDKKSKNVTRPFMWIHACEHNYLIYHSNDGPAVLGRLNNSKDFSLDDLYDEKHALVKPASILVPLNLGNTAQVFADKIVVGCQQFHPEVIEKLAAAHKQISAVRQSSGENVFPE